MDKITKAAAAIVTAAVFLVVLTESKAVLRSRASIQDFARNKRSLDERKDWLKNATARIQFEILVLNNNRLPSYLSNSGVYIGEASFPTYPVSKTCQKIADGIPYGTDVYQEGQGDLLARTDSFRFLLRKAIDCLSAVPSAAHYRKLLNRATSVDTSLRVFITNITDLCEKHCKDGQGENCTELKDLCNKGTGEYVGDVGNTCSYFNQGEDSNYVSPDTYEEQMFIIATYLQCFLHRLESTESVSCTASGPKVV